VTLDPQLLDILACPDAHHTALDYDESAQTLTCPQCHRVFRIDDGIPVLLLDEAALEDQAATATGSATANGAVTENEPAIEDEAGR
jgi:uncharacterized protein YbaR (Trm112 family)